MPRGLCVDCFTEIKRGVRCSNCANHGGGNPGPLVHPDRVVLMRLNRCINGRWPHGLRYTVFSSRSAAGIWRWYHARAHRCGTRLWIEKQEEPATLPRIRESRRRDA